MQSNRIRILSLVAALVGAGCAPRQRNPDQPSVTQPVVRPVAVDRAATERAARRVPVDPPREPITILTLTVYNITLPQGVVSASSEFWKRVNEQSLNVHAYDTLYQNGIRVGIAAAKEWDYFREIIDQHPATTVRTEYSATETRASEIVLREDVPEQTIFHLDPSGHLEGRSFDQSDNLLALSYGPAPRKPETIRITLCPMIRTSRARIEFLSNGSARELQMVRPERMFDCSLTADVPLNGVLIIAPSVEGRWPTSIGNNFLTADGNAERMERLLLLVPRAARAEKSQQAVRGQTSGGR